MLSNIRMKNEKRVNIFLTIQSIDFLEIFYSESKIFCVNFPWKFIRFLNFFLGNPKRWLRCLYTKVDNVCISVCFCLYVDTNLSLYIFQTFFYQYWVIMCGNTLLLSNQLNWCLIWTLTMWRTWMWVTDKIGNSFVFTDKKMLMTLIKNCRFYKLFNWI